MRLAQELLRENGREKSFEVTALDADEFQHLPAAFQALGCEVVSRNAIKRSFVVNCATV